MNSLLPLRISSDTWYAPHATFVTRRFTFHTYLEFAKLIQTIKVCRKGKVVETLFFNQFCPVWCGLELLSYPVLIGIALCQIEIPTNSLQGSVSIPDNSAWELYLGICSLFLSKIDVLRILGIMLPSSNRFLSPYEVARIIHRDGGFAQIALRLLDSDNLRLSKLRSEVSHKVFALLEALPILQRFPAPGLAFYEELHRISSSQKPFLVNFHAIFKWIKRLKSVVLKIESKVLDELYVKQL